MNKMTVDEYILRSGPWEQSLIMLREIVLSLGMEETVKWGIPVYCLNGKNIVGFASFKAYTGLWFYQGVYLRDNKKKLVSATDGATRALRQWRFKSVDEIENELDLIVAYLKEAVENSKQGKEIKPVKNRPFKIPSELMDAFATEPELKKHFDMLSHSKRREYALYIEQAKQEETRHKRLNKSIPQILKGLGLMDKYQK